MSRFKPKGKVRNLAFIVPFVGILAYSFLNKTQKVSVESSKLDLGTIGEQSHDSEMPVDLDKCYDGDTCTFKLKKGDIKIRVRLVGIDSPELPRKGKKGQPLAEESRDEIRRLLSLGSVSVKSHGLDPYNRILGEIFVRDSRTQDLININLEMVRSGLAWFYTKSPSSIEKALYQKAEDQARLKKIGVWSGTEKQATAEEFRRSSRRKLSSH